MSKPVHKEPLAAAKALDKAGEWDQAARVYEEILAQEPDHAAAHWAYGSALAKRRKPEGESHLRRALELDPTNPKLRVDFAKRLTKAGQLDEASQLLEAVLADDPDNMSAIFALASVREGLGDLDGAFTMHRRAIELGPARDQAGLHGAFAAFLTRQAQDVAEQAARLDPDSAKLAATHGIALSRAGRLDEAAEELKRAAELDPGIIDLRRELVGIQRLKAAPAVQHRRPAPWPTSASAFDNYEKLIRRYVLGDVPEGLELLTSSTKVATMGSCFATHVAQRLEARGVDCFYKLIHEDINSTYANRYLLDWVVDGVTDEHTANFEALYGAEERLDWEKNLRGSDLFIFSLGVGTSFFDRNTGEFVLNLGGKVEGASLADLYHHRMVTLDENVLNTRRIIDQLRRLNPTVSIVLTVSPVALGGTYDRRSAVLADCVSKSTLRLTVEEVLNEGVEDLYYWPSFEMVRWLGAHLPASHTPPFAADDGRTRHVSLWLQDLIIALFIEYVGDGSVGDALGDSRRDGRADEPGDSVHVPGLSEAKA